MPDVFVSYSRKDRAFAASLNAALVARGLDVWIDLEDIPPSADWWARIRGAIDASNAVVFLLSDHSAESKVCADEVDHAVRRGKRLVPVSIGVTKVQAVPEALRRLNWIVVGADGLSDDIVGTTVEALRTDLEHVESHTRLLVRAVEWGERSRRRSLLLRGEELRESESWLTLGGGKEPAPTVLQREYIEASRVWESRRQRLVTYASLTAVGVASTLSVVAFVQRQNARAESVRAVEQRNAADSARVLADRERAEAVRQARVALGRQLAAQAESMPDQDPKSAPRAALLAIEALRRADSAEVDRAARRVLRLLPRPMGVVRHDSQSAHWWVMAVSPDGRTLVASRMSAEVAAFDAESGARLATLVEKGDSPRATAEFSRDGRRVLFIGDANTGTRLFDAATWERVGEPEPGATVAAFSEDQSQVVFARSDGVAIVVSVEDGTRLASVNLGRVAARVAMPADGRSINAAYDEDRRAGKPAEIVRWWLANGSQLSRLECKGSREWLAMSPDGRWAIDAAVVDSSPLGSSSGRLWDAKEGRLARVLPMLPDQADVKAAFDTSSSRYALACADHTVRVWETRGRGEWIPAKFREHVSRLAISTDGRRIGAASYDDTARVCDIESGRELARRTHSDYVTFLALNADASIFASSMNAGGEGSRILIDRASDWSESIHWRFAVTEEPDDTFDVALTWSGDGSRIAAEYFTEDEKSPRTRWRREWSASDGVVIGEPAKIADPPSNERRQAALRAIAVDWAARAGVKVDDPGLAIGGFDFGTVAVSIDGRYLCDMPAGATTRVFDAQSGGKAVVRTTHDANSWNSAAFSADSSLVATSTKNPIRSGSVLKIHELPSGRLRTELSLPWGTWSLAFSPDGRRLAIASDDGVARVLFVHHDAPGHDEDLVGEIARRVRRNLSREEWRRHFGEETYAPTIPGMPIPTEIEGFGGGFETAPEVAAEGSEGAAGAKESE